LSQIVLWERLDAVSIEYLILSNANELTLSTGLIIGVMGEKPFKVSYSVEHDAHMGLRQVVCGSNGEFVLHYAGDGHWQDQQGQPLSQFDGCTSIDIAETPFTNTLAIKQLQLKPGEAGELTVAWFQLAEGTWEPNRQRYTCIEKSAQGSVYRFEQLSSGFTATLPFDKNDLVIDYPELFRRIYPKVSDNT
jgi:hypothetical protein